MSGRWLEWLARFDRAGRFVETTLLVSILAGLMLVAVGQIVLRDVFTFGFIWANELQNLMVLWLAMIATVAASRDDRHIRIDALSRVLPPGAARAARVVVDLFAAVVCGIVGWQVYRYLQIEFEYKDVVLVNIPAWLAHAVLPIAFALSAYRFVVNAVKKAVGFGADEDGGTR